MNTKTITIDFPHTTWECEHSNTGIKFVLLIPPKEMSGIPMVPIGAVLRLTFQANVPEPKREITLSQLDSIFRETEGIRNREQAIREKIFGRENL